MWPFKKKQTRVEWATYQLGFDFSEPKSITPEAQIESLKVQVGALQERLGLLEDYLQIVLARPPKGYRKIRKSR
jgi:hypothetical protein